jgi:hypothetical protein
MLLAKLTALFGLALLLTGCLFLDDNWLWGSSCYESCWTSSDCTIDTDGCFEVAVDYGTYGVSDRMCSAYCDSDWDCPYNGACYSFPVRQALTDAGATDAANTCTAEGRDQDVCSQTPTEQDGTTQPPTLVSVAVGPALSVGSPAYASPICYQRCSGDWECPWGFACIEVYDFPFFDSICLPY